MKTSMYMTVVRPMTDRTTTIVKTTSTVTWKSAAMTMRTTIVTTISRLRTTTVVREKCSVRIGKVQGSSVATVVAVIVRSIVFGTIVVRQTTVCRRRERSLRFMVTMKKS